MAKIKEKSEPALKKAVVSTKKVTDADLATAKKIYTDCLDKVENLMSVAASDLNKYPYVSFVSFLKGTIRYIQRARKRIR